MRIRLPLLAVVFCSVSTLFAQNSDLEALKSQVMQMQKNYETRISALEKKIEQLEAGDKVKTQTIEELKQSNQVQQKNISTLALGLQGTNVTADIFALTRQNQSDISSIEEKLEKGLNGLEYSGYMRSGFGTCGDGEIQPAFIAPGAGSKYRLGNEAETYLEMTFKHSTPREDILSDTLSIDTQIRLALSTPMDKTATADTDTSLREAFAVAHGAISSIPEIDFWAGQRFYNRYDVHINDYYFYDMSGTGGGVENIPLFGSEAKLSFAWIGGSTDDLNADGSVVLDNDFNLNTDTLNLGVNDIPFLYGKLNILSAYSSFNGDTVSDEDGNRYNIDDGSGGSLSLIQKNIWEEWENQFALQYGTGAAYNFRATLNRPTTISIENVTDMNLDDFRTFRILNNLTRTINERWVMSGLLLCEDFDTGDDKYTWYSGGLRPVYHLNNTFSLAFEAGVDHSSSDSSQSGELYKLTIAPQISPDTRFFSRPELRLFLTYAWWTEEFEGQVGGPKYEDDTHGVSAGIQLETWW